MNSVQHMLMTLIYINGNNSENGSHVSLELNKLQKAECLDIDKCGCSVKRTKHLGFILSAKNAIPSKKMDPEKVKAISDWEAPTTIKGLRGFLGFVNFYRGFIEGYSKICAPNTALKVKKNTMDMGLIARRNI